MAWLVGYLRHIGCHMVELENNTSPEPHEVMLREHLAYTLDSQLGRSEARFREYLKETEELPLARRVLRFPTRPSGWAMGIAGAAFAASLGALWAGPSLQHVLPAPAAVSVTPSNTTAVSDPLLVEQDVQSQTFDDGTIMLDGKTPVRVLRRRDVERTRWFDHDRKLQGEQVVPQDHVVYVHVKTY